MENRDRLFNTYYENVKNLFLTSDDYFIWIDGFAILFEIIQNKHINWKMGYKKIASGGVYLHFIYCVERFVNMFLKLKRSIKIVLFDSTESILAADPGISLAYELMVFHLRRLPQFNTEMVFCKIDEYEQLISKERVAAFFAFSPCDLILNESTLKDSLRKNLTSIIELNLNMGITVVSTKNFWYDTNYGKAFLIYKSKNFQASSAKLVNISMPKFDYPNNIEYSRISFYSYALEHTNPDFRKYFIMHLYLLEKLSMETRIKIALNEKMIVNTLFKRQLADEVELFKFNLSMLFYSLNKLDIVNENNNYYGSHLNDLCDIFDDRLFYKTIFLLEPIQINWEHLMQKMVESKENYSDFSKAITQTHHIKLPIRINNTIKLENELFRTYLQNEFIIDDNSNQIKNAVEFHLSDEKLDEFLQFEDAQNAQWVITKFAIYLEKYAKSFEFTIKCENMNSMLNNIVEEVSEDAQTFKNMKKADQIIYMNKKNKLEKYNKATSSPKNLSDMYIELKKLHSRTVKLDLLKNYLKLLIKSIESSNDKMRQVNFALDYYKAAESSLRVFNRDESLCKIIQDDFEVIFKKIERPDGLIPYQLTDAQFHLHREHFGRPDTRVTGFVPDLWQIQLMDVIDERKSCIVVAPTSSGKTFSSFYALEKVLKNKKKPNAVAVYVAPTKALINQMLASIYSRFKKVDPGKNKQLIGVFTRDHVENVLSCRVLLTVPECLEIIYFNMKSYSSVANNIDYIVFDEFQSINDEYRGKTWERTLLFCTCPFLALSATIKNAKTLCSWLNKSNEIKHGPEVILIEYKQPSTEFVYNVLVKNENKLKLKSISPLSCIDGSHTKNTHELINNICLTPNDTLMLHSELKKEKHILDLEQIEMLNQNGSFITRNNVKQFEEYLKNELKSASQESVQKYNNVMTIFHDELSQENFARENDLPKLIDLLKEKDLLPCLIFGFDRKNLEKCTRILYEYYENKEKCLRETVYKTTIEELNKKREANRIKEMSNRDKKPSKRNNNEETFDSNQTDETDYSLLDEFLPECSISESCYFDKTEIDERIDRGFGKDPNNWQRRALKRGFFYHHGGLNNKQRVCVESLFRTKYLKLVFCTSTLAQGIHVPCKTVAFLENSQFFDVGMFKQCIGRAGRRGFDSHANVIFINIPRMKIKNLISSSNPDVKGNFTLSPTFVLKLLNLNSSSNFGTAVNNNLLKSSLNLLNNSLMNFHDEAINKSLVNILTKFYFMFCTNFLYENSLININGKGIGLNNLTSRLSYHDHGTLALNYLLNKGIFHSLYNGNNQDKEDIRRKIIIIISHLFNRVEITNLKEASEMRTLKTSNSQVILDDFPIEFIEPIDIYNQRVHNIVIENLKNQTGVFEQNQQHAGWSLPLSKFSYEKKNASFESDVTLEDLICNADSCVEKEIDIISKFSALSGLHDEHYNFQIKDKSLLIHFNSNYLDYKDLYPTITIDSTDYYGREVKLNSFLLDFYNHGIYECILKENKLRSDSAFELVKDFKMILASLANIYNPLNEDDELVKDLNFIYKKYLQNFTKAKFHIDVKN